LFAGYILTNYEGWPILNFAIFTNIIKSITLVLPDIYLFNPTCEYAVANGNPSWQPNRLLQKMEADLAVLPLFFAGKNDFILVNEKPSEEYLSSFRDFGFELPHFVEKRKINSLLLQQPGINKLEPWGWSPKVHRFLEPLKTNCSEDFKKSPVFNWMPDYKDFYSKKFALQVLSLILSDNRESDFISQNNTGRVCTSLSEIEIRLKQWDKIMVKAPWGSSGRGLQPVTKTPVHTKVWEKILGIITEQGYAIVEPFLDKVMDFAFQFEIKKGDVAFLGVSCFRADKKGQYEGNYLNGLEMLPPKVPKDFVKKITEKIVPRLIHCFENSELALKYEGNIGVDTLVFLDKKRELKINPCLEINLRKNMGLLSLYLEKMLAKGKQGMLKTYYNKGIPFIQFKKEMQRKYPLKTSNNKIDSGFFALTDAKPEALFGAYILV